MPQILPQPTSPPPVTASRAYIAHFRPSRRNSVISTVKEQRAGICGAPSISIKNLGWENVDDEPSVLIIYEVMAPISFRTVQHLYGNYHFLVWGPNCVFSFTKHVYLTDGRTQALHLLQVHWWKGSSMHSSHLTQYRLCPARVCKCLVPKGYGYIQHLEPWSSVRSYW